MIKVEQIFNNDIVIDYDEKLSKKQIIDIINNDFKTISKNNPYVIVMDNIEIKLFIKQITYLGNPHLIFKKRIQISKGWASELKEENTFLIGLYKYKETIIYTFFDKNNFINRVTNNSSAHVSTFDLLNSNEKGEFTKKDIRGNLITTIKRDNIIDFIRKLIKKEVKFNDEIELFEKFKSTLNKNYTGIECYKEMIKSDFRKKFQPEWVGFFLEYKFENFLNFKPDFKLICNYQSNKKKGDIDLDLNFNNNFLGDLKAHSNDSNAILGNDKNNIEKALLTYNKIWYIVFNHNTYRDSEYNFEVTMFWNKEQNKDNLMSYSNKMKHNISFTDFKILEINNYNKQYLSDFNQGKNSNGMPREKKIKIDKKCLNNFLIYNGLF